MTILIDGRGHLMGRLASGIAKQLLEGQSIVVVRCEELERSGAIWRNQKVRHEFTHKTNNTNPLKGPAHERSPAKIFMRMVRGMLPHKTERGKAAFARLQTFEGIPHPFDKQQRVVVPRALRVVRLRPDRRFTNLGELCKANGWKKYDLIKTLEEKRKAKSAIYFQNKKAQ
eukprot:TRINITY_DN588143_c0_g1_i1.p1 TRINITY_DN588143_c0_g1~~TRINITY_DN588143_c0_g1_i1.p1  ORF type:complete len:171 (+),score=36.95 TRINITY_DN588143_c0_g1_i1:103-615(+)